MCGARVLVHTNHLEEPLFQLVLEGLRLRDSVVGFS